MMEHVLHVFWRNNIAILGLDGLRCLEHMAMWPFVKKLTKEFEKTPYPNPVYIGMYTTQDQSQYHLRLVDSTHLKTISQIGSFPQVGMKIKNIWNHHLDLVFTLLHLVFTLLSPQRSSGYEAINRN